MRKLLLAAVATLAVSSAQAGTNVPDGYVQPTLDTPTSPAAYTFDQAVDTCAARTVAGGYSAFSAYVVNDGNHNKVQEWTNPRLNSFFTDA